MAVSGGELKSRLSKVRAESSICEVLVVMGVMDPTGCRVEG